MLLLHSSTVFLNLRLMLKLHVNFCCHCTGCARRVQWFPFFDHTVSSFQDRVCWLTPLKRASQDGSFK